MGLASRLVLANENINGCPFQLTGTDILDLFVKWSQKWYGATVTNLPTRGLAQLKQREKRMSYNIYGYKHGSSIAQCCVSLPLGFRAHSGIHYA